MPWCSELAAVDVVCSTAESVLVLLPKPGALSSLLLRNCTPHTKSWNFRFFLPHLFFLFFIPPAFRLNRIVWISPRFDFFNLL